MKIKVKIFSSIPHSGRICRLCHRERTSLEDYMPNHFKHFRIKSTS